MMKKSKIKGETKIKPLSDIEWTTLWMAVRYAMNRQTIASATLPSDIIRSYYDRLSETEKASLCRDLQENFERLGKFGDSRIDHRHWMKFWRCLDAKNHVRVKISGNEVTCFVVLDRLYPLAEYIAAPNSEIYLPSENVDPEPEDSLIEIELTVIEGKRILLVWKGSPLLRSIPVINEAITELGFTAAYPVDANRFYAERTDAVEVGRLLAEKGFVVLFNLAEENG